MPWRIFQAKRKLHTKTWYVSVLRILRNSKKLEWSEQEEET